MPVKEIVQVRCGIFKQYTNGMRTRQSYCIWLGDGKRTVTIECAKGWFVRSSVIEDRFKGALQGVWDAVVVRLLDQCIADLRSGKGFEIGGLTFDQEGIHRKGQYSEFGRTLLRTRVKVFGGDSAEERERKHFHANWENVSYASANGNVSLFYEKKPWASFALRETWNAVLIEPLLEYLWKEGRLWDVIGRSPVRDGKSSARTD
jgi:hypothetical protein